MKEKIKFVNLKIKKKSKKNLSLTLIFCFNVEGHMRNFCSKFYNSRTMFQQIKV